MIDLIAIDGPVGVGKSSVARLLAARFGWQHLDSGAMYRSVSLLALRRGIDPEDEEACHAIAEAMNFEFRPTDGEQRVIVDGKDVTEAIRSHEVTAAVSGTADKVAVRTALGALQKKLGQGARTVVEGRDMGTVVFPDARWKFFLDADPRERAGRRGLQLREEGRPMPEDELLASIGERDRRDRTRPVGALRVASDAILLDTTGIGLARVVAIVEGLVRNDLAEDR